MYAKKGTCRAGNASDYKIDGTRRHLIGNKESLTTSSTVRMIYDLAFPGTQKCQDYMQLNQYASLHCNIVDTVKYQWYYRGFPKETLCLSKPDFLKC